MEQLQKITSIALAFTVHNNEFHPSSLNNTVLSIAHYLHFMMIIFIHQQVV